MHVCVCVHVLCPSAILTRQCWIDFPHAFCFSIAFLVYFFVVVCAVVDAAGCLSSWPFPLAFGRWRCFLVYRAWCFPYSIQKKKKENKRVSFSGGQEHPELARGTEFSLGQQMCPLITSSSALPIRRRPLPASRQGVVSYLYPEVTLNFFFYSSHPIRPDRTLPVCFASRRTLPFVFVCFCAVSSFGSYLLHSLPLQPFAGEYATVIICRLRPIFGFGK